jgi:hypothetical protein
MNRTFLRGTTVPHVYLAFLFQLLEVAHILRYLETWRHYDRGYVLDIRAVSKVNKKSSCEFW